MATVAFDTTLNPATPTSPRKVSTNTALVAVNTSQGSCDVLDISGIKFMAVKPPASVTSLTFYASTTPGGTFVLINDLGTLGVVNVTASVWQSIDYTKLAPYRYIQMKSAGASGSCEVVGST